MNSCTKSCSPVNWNHYYEIDPGDSWMLAAAEKNLPLVVPGWEDSTTG